MYKHSYVGKSEAERLADRLKSSAGSAPNQHTHGSGPTRTVTTVHHNQGNPAPTQLRGDEDNG